MKVLVAQPGGPGDLVLSLPVFKFIKARRPDFLIHALVSPGLVPLLENNSCVDRIWTWAPGDPCVRRDLLRGFKQEEFGAAVMLQYHHEL